MPENALKNYFTTRLYCCLLKYVYIFVAQIFIYYGCLLYICTIFVT